MAVIYDIKSAQCEHILVKTRQFVRKCKGCKKFKWPWSKAVGCIKCMKVWHRRCQPPMTEPTATVIEQDTVALDTPLLQACLPQTISGAGHAVVIPYVAALVTVAKSPNSVVVTGSDTMCMGRFTDCCRRPLGLGKPTTFTWTFIDIGLESSSHHVFRAHLPLQHFMPAFGHPKNLIEFKTAAVPSEQATCTLAIADVAPPATAPLATAATTENTKTSRCRRINCKSRRCRQCQLHAELKQSHQ